MSDLNYSLIFSPPLTKGYLAIGICPGRKDDKYNRDLSTDLTYIKQHFNIIISLQENFEYAAHGVPDYVNIVTNYGIPLVSVPIKDRNISDLNTTIQLVDYIYNLLEQGYQIYMHCLGGLGRSGTIAACVGLKLGIRYVDIIKYIRDRRPYAIQTKSQKNMILSYNNYLLSTKQ